GRGYAATGELVLEVLDERGPAGGRYLLEAGPDGARCRRVDRTPELVLPVAELGSLLAGGTSWRTLARAGRAGEAAPGSRDRPDALSPPARAAYCATECCPRWAPPRCPRARGRQRTAPSTTQRSPANRASSTPARVTMSSPSAAHSQ